MIKIVEKLQQPPWRTLRGLQVKIFEMGEVICEAILFGYSMAGLAMSSGFRTIIEINPCFTMMKKLKVWRN